MSKSVKCDFFMLKWFVFIFYYLAVSLLHLKFSMFLGTPLPSPLQNIRPIYFVNHALVISFLILLLMIVLQALNGKRRRETLLFWALWLVSVYMSDQFLVFKTVEYIHYPQYAVLAALLAWCIDPGRRSYCVVRILFWVAVLGILDETNQYLYLAKNYGDYLDFNDFYLNLQGAMAGVLLVYGFRNIHTGHIDYGQDVESPVKMLVNSIEIRFVLAVFVFLLIMSTSGRLQFSPPEEIPPGGRAYVKGKTVFYIERKPGITGGWNSGERRDFYYVLNPLQGISLLLITGLVFIPFGFRKMGVRKFEE